MGRGDGEHGHLTLREAGLGRTDAKIIAMGISPDGDTAVIAAVDATGRQVVVRVGTSHSPSPGVAIWVDGTESLRSPTATLGTPSITTS